MLQIKLPSLRYSNVFRFLVIFDMIILTIMWIIGSSIDEKSELNQIIKFHFTESIFDIVFLSSFKALILFILISEIESSCYKIAINTANQVKKSQSVDISSSTNTDDTESLIDTQQNSNGDNSVKKYLQAFTLVISLVSFAFILVKFGFVTNLFINAKKNDDKYPMSIYFYAILITEMIFCFLEFLLSLLNWRFMRNFAKLVCSKALANETEAIDDKKKVNIRRLISLSYPERYFIFSAFIMLIVSSFTNIVSPYFFGSVVDSAVNYTDLSKMNKYIFYLLGIYLIGSLASGIRSWLFEVAGQRVVARLRRQVFNAIIKSDITFFDTSRTGELTSRISSDTQVLQSAVTTNISMFARYFLQIIGSIIFMFSLEPSLSGLLIGVIPIISLLTVQYGRYLKKLKKKFQDELAASSVVAEETISSMRTVRSFAAEGKMSKEYEINIGKSFDIGKKLAVAQGGFMGFVGMISGGALALVLWYGGKLVHDKKISTGILASFLMYTLQVAMAFAFLSSVYGDFMQALGASQRIFELLDRDPLIKLNSGIIPADEDSFDGSIEFEKVDFSYPTRPQSQVLSNVCLKIEKGKTIALVGPSGGGKSTIFALIERFYDPLAGSITLGPRNFDLKSINTNWLHSKIALVSQEPVLFGGTIKENISFGLNDEIDTEQIIEVSKLANAHDFIINFEKGYDTVVGEKGIRLSGGQKQRIAIARALLVNPKLLLLDEATSALDSESEHLVQEAIERAMKDRTVCVIAHRLSTVRNADRVIVLENGQIVEQGTHEELCSIDGIYKRLVLKQLLSKETVINDS
uniref:ATP-binding cassette transporter subfamily B member 10-like protein n=1 Tax=Brachionus rotundiformis TaxID=96890 RepID=A0A7H9SL60_9BILA|nr:ATP-binding cassette transporter subfamily B member 10-like protein [Brachionus rotundiformis]